MPISCPNSKALSYSYYENEPWKPATSEEDFAIRLIELYPSKSTEDQAHSEQRLQCRLFWAPLRSRPHFTALSYTWGDGAKKSKIIISDKEFEITTSLEEAMLHLRGEFEPLVIWIDQICINQKNNAEKSEQVAHMSDIYRAAHEVLVWLGKAEDGSDHFMDVWSQIGRWAEDWGMMGYYTKENFPKLHDIWHKVNPTDPKTIEYDNIRHRAVALFDAEFLYSMIAWHQRPWFTRVWVVQEYSLAQVAIFNCGDRRITAEQALLARQVFDTSTENILHQASDATRSAMAIISQVDDPCQPFFSSRQQWKKINAGLKPATSMYSLLQKLFMDNRMRATEPCDTIYGLLALANDAKKLNIIPDYSLKDHVEVLYTRTTKAIIADGNVDILALSQYPKYPPRRRNLPTWVPDWTSTIRRSFAKQSDVDTPYFAASGKSSPEILWVKDERVLGLGGFWVDQVQELGGIWDGDAPPQNTRATEKDAAKESKKHVNESKAVAEEGNEASKERKKEVEPITHHYGYLNVLAQVRLMCLLSAQKNNPIYASISRRHEGYWRIPIGDIQEARMEQPRRATSEWADAHRACMALLECFEEVTTPTSPGELEQRDAEFNRNCYKGGGYRSRMHEMQYKRPFMTNMGYVGMGPTCMRPGDIIVVFMGARLPYVVRGRGDGSFQFIGECYCDGIMDGEIVRQRPKQSFYLV
ncbi:HET-domain-containing protein [Cenococcum geophilum 1.58]|uniref:HET-domain-containing protein n=1 Tax=Cenococcum geophilum 1.58 TaxID=794803 RepID=UPI00358F68CD|nr:HET-domain-containing protein [Cenococcum geophilum 1.58]